MNIIDFCFSIFNNGSLESKLINPSIVNNFELTVFEKLILPEAPSRDQKIGFNNNKKSNFPKKNQFKSEKSRAKALHFFANHELLAIEIMCFAILRCSHTVDHETFKKISKKILKTIQEEQKHFKLYQSRINELGAQFGDFPINSFFWDKSKSISSFDEYFSLMALTFEVANLDFCLYYEKVFNDVHDHKSANILRTIYNDELSHVALGLNWLDIKRNDQSLWNYYLQCLPKEVSPNRSKGIQFNKKIRKNLGFPKDFIEELSKFNDGFKVAKRKSN